MCIELLVFIYFFVFFVFVVTVRDVIFDKNYRDGKTNTHSVLNYYEPVQCYFQEISFGCYVC